MKQYIDKQDISHIYWELWENGLPKVVSANEIKAIEPMAFRQFLHEIGVYAYPTKELIEFLGNELVGTSIEIGCGYGQIGRSLGLPITDAKVQEIPEVKAYYLQNGQPIIQYPKDVEKLEAQEAIKKYKPQTVIGTYITHKWNGKCGSVYGVVEGKILATCKYINVGSDLIHYDKPILKYDHKTYRFEWLITRNIQQQNFIKVWQKAK
jgi:hypothetical protein